MLNGLLKMTGAYRAYESYLVRQIAGDLTPTHIGIILDGKIIQPSFEILEGRYLSGEMTYNQESANFKNLFLETFTGSYYAEGIIPINLSPFKKESSFYTNQTLDFSVTGESTEFEFLTPFFEVIDSLQGNFDVRVLSLPKKITISKNTKYKLLKYIFRIHTEQTTFSFFYL